MPASMPTRHGGRFTNRAAIRAREIFSRRTIAPLSSRPIICSVFLPVSIPMVRATAVSALLGMACPPRALQSPQPTLRVVGGGSTAGPGARPVHPIRDRRLGDLKAKHQQLAMDPRCSPVWVFLAHPSDEIAQLAIDLWPPCPLPRFPTPERRETRTMPAKDGLRLN